MGPAAGLGWVRSESGADPDTAGSVATYRVVLIADAGDTIVANGLRQVVLLFGTDSDFSGSLAGVTESDVRVTVDDGTRTTAVDGFRVKHNAAGDRLRITLSTPASVAAGDRLTVAVDGVESSALSAADADAERFSLRVKAFDPTGARDVRTVRYTLRAGEKGAEDPAPTPAPAPTRRRVVKRSCSHRAIRVSRSSRWVTAPRP